MENGEEVGGGKKRETESALFAPVVLCMSLAVLHVGGETGGEEEQTCLAEGDSPTRKCAQ